MSKHLYKASKYKRGFLSTILINYKLKYLRVRGKNSQVKTLGHSIELTLMLLNIFLYVTLF